MASEILNDETVAGLLQYYRQSGLDMTYLLGDPIFQAMGVQQKIEFIKSRAGEILDNSTYGLTRSQKQGIITHAAIGGASVVPVIYGIATKILSNGTSHPSMAWNALKPAAAIGVGTGVLVGGLAGYLKAREERDHRRDLMNSLENAAYSPTTANAIGVLNSNYISAKMHPTRDALYEKAVSLFKGSKPSEIVEDTYNQGYKTQLDFAGPDGNRTARRNYRQAYREVKNK